jgi:hypothetical protein
MDFCFLIPGIFVALALPGVIGFVAVHCLRDGEVKQVRLVFFFHIIVCTLDMLAIASPKTFFGD